MDESGTRISSLETELQSKNQQISTLSTTLSNLQEELREKVSFLFEIIFYFHPMNQLTNQPINVCIFDRKKLWMKVEPESLLLKLNSNQKTNKFQLYQPHYQIKQKN